MADRPLSERLQVHGEKANPAEVRALEKRLDEADLRNKLLLKRGNEVVEELGEAEARVQVLEEALKVAADDLAKAANQFKGLLPDGQNWRKFEEKCERAEAVLASEGTPEEASESLVHICGDDGRLLCGEQLKGSRYCADFLGSKLATCPDCAARL